MLEQILEKLHCASIEEFFENERRIWAQFSDMEIERANPLLSLTDEEMDYFEMNILPKLNHK